MIFHAVRQMAAEIDSNLASKRNIGQNSHVDMSRQSLVRFHCAEQCVRDGREGNPPAHPRMELNSSFKCALTRPSSADLGDFRAPF